MKIKFIVCFLTTMVLCILFFSSKLIAIYSLKYPILNIFENNIVVQLSKQFCDLVKNSQFENYKNELLDNLINKTSSSLQSVSTLAQANDFQNFQFQDDIIDIMEPKENNQEINIPSQTTDLKDKKSNDLDTKEQNKPDQINNNIKIDFEKNTTKQTEKIELKHSQLKIKNEKKVLLIGDSLMQGIGMGMKLVNTNDDIKIQNIAKVSSGLINQKFFDWKKKLEQTLQDDKDIDYIIVLFGANDTFAIKDGKYLIKFDNPKWDALYTKRILQIYQVAKNKKIIWLGLPCMRSNEFNEQMKKITLISKNIAKENGAKFIDTNKFVCPNNKYIANIKNDNKLEKLRGKDGIHFTMHGYKILAKQVLDTID